MKEEGEVPCVTDSVMSVTSTAFEIKPPEVESSLSSIGNNSDDEAVGSRSSALDEENEAQSRYSRLLYAMEELEQVLPMRRGISKFYNGKSKSFTSLADASASSSIQEIVKLENMYARRSRNLLAFNRVWDNGRSSSPRKGNATGRISKRSLGSSKSTLALAVAMTHSESYNYSSASDDSSSSNFFHSPPPAIHLPLLHPRSQGSLDHHGSTPTIHLPLLHPRSQGSLDHHGSTPRPTCVIDRPLPSIVLKTSLEEQT